MHSSRRARPAIRRWRCSLAGTTGSAGRRWSGAGRAAIVVWSTLARILAVAQRQVVDAMTSCRASPPSPSSWPTSVVVAATHWQVRSASAAWRQPGDRRNRRPQRGCRKARARNPLRLPLAILLAVIDLTPMAGVTLRAVPPLFLFHHATFSDPGEHDGCISPVLPAGCSLRPNLTVSAPSIPPTSGRSSRGECA